MARWLEILAMYDMKIEHRQGRVHNNAASLSRRPCASESCSHGDKKDHRFDTHRDVQTQTDMTYPETLIEIWSSLSSEMMVGQCNKVSKTTARFPGNDSDGSSVIGNESESLHDIMKSIQETGVISLIDLKKLQENDKVLGRLMTWIKSCEKPEWGIVSPESREVKYYFARWDSLNLRQGILYQKWESDLGHQIVWKLILPKELRPFVLKELHSSPSSGHLGDNKTLERIKARFFWYGMRRDVEHLCKTCD